MKIGSTINLTLIEKNRLQNFPYTTTWKDGQPNAPPPKNNNNKVTPNPLSINLVNLIDDPEFVAEPTWCFAWKLPRSPESCIVTLSILGNQIVVEKSHEHEEDNDDVACNMFESHYSNYEDYDRDVHDQIHFQNVTKQQVFFTWE